MESVGARMNATAKGEACFTTDCTDCADLDWKESIREIRVIRAQKFEMQDSAK
jgi:hypothetical protein